MQANEPKYNLIGGWMKVGSGEFGFNAAPRYWSFGICGERRLQRGLGEQGRREYRSLVNGLPMFPAVRGTIHARNGALGFADHYRSRPAPNSRSHDSRGLGLGHRQLRPFGVGP